MLLLLCYHVAKLTKQTRSIHYHHTLSLYIEIQPFRYMGTLHCWWDRLDWRFLVCNSCAKLASSGWLKNVVLCSLYLKCFELKTLIFIRDLRAKRILGFGLLKSGSSIGYQKQVKIYTNIIFLPFLCDY